MLGIIMTIRDDEDRSFVEELFLKDGRKLYLIANDILHHHEDSEDCVMKTLEVIIEKLEIYRALSREQQIKFLVKTCRNIALSRYDRKKRQNNSETSLDAIREISQYDAIDESAYIDKMVVNEENIKRLSEMIDELDPIYRDVLFFKGVMQMKNSEIAKMLDISESLVSMRLIRARKILLAKRGEELNEIRNKR